MEKEAAPFNFLVHLIDPKSGRVNGENPYVRHSMKHKGTIYQRGDKFFYENGTEVPPGDNWVKITKQSEKK